MHTQSYLLPPKNKKQKQKTTTTTTKETKTKSQKNQTNEQKKNSLPQIFGVIASFVP